MLGPFKSCLIDWDTLRDSDTPYHSNDGAIVKEMSIGQSAAKYPSGINVQRLFRKEVLLKKGKQQLYLN